MDVTIIYKKERDNLIIPSLNYGICRDVFNWWIIEDVQNEKDYKTHNIDCNDIKIKLVRDNISDIIMIADKDEIENRQKTKEKAKAKEKITNPLA